jgi:ubiquinone/menaquinone biosynthesis C-methylase UbiE
LSSSHFDEIATVYDESLPGHIVEHYLRKRTAFIAATCPRGRALDVGCGTGTLAARLAAEGYDVSGVDPSAGMLEVLRDRHPELEAVVASGIALPFDEDTFDLVFCVAVMHHVADPADVRHTLAEMVRVSRPGGRVLVWDHNPRNPYWGRLMARVPQDTGEERLISEEEVVGGLRAAGAQILASRQLGIVPDFVPARALPAAARLERLFEATPLLHRLAAHNVVLAMKPPAR